MNIKKVYKDRESFAVEMLNKYSKQAPNNTLSDIGSGFGWFEKHAINAGFDWQPFDYIRKIDASIEWNLNEPAPGNSKSAGISVMLEVLEHLPNPLLSIQHIAAHLAEGAILILSVPNPSWSRNRLNLLIHGTLYSFQKKHLDEYHVFTPWQHIVEHLFEQSGFEAIEYHTIEQQSHNSTNIKGTLLKWAQMFIEAIDPQSKGLSYGLVLRRK